MERKWSVFLLCSSLDWRSVLQSQSGGSPHSSPSHGAGCSMPMPIRSTSAGSTPTHTPQDCLAGVGGDVLEAFAQGESPEAHCPSSIFFAACRDPASVPPAARCTKESSERSARRCRLDHKHDVVAGEGAALRSVACSRSGSQGQQCAICPPPPHGLTPAPV